MNNEAGKTIGSAKIWERTEEGNNDILKTLTYCG